VRNKFLVIFIILLAINSFPNNPVQGVNNEFSAYESPLYLLLKSGDIQFAFDKTYGNLKSITDTEGINYIQQSDENQLFKITVEDTSTNRLIKDHWEKAKLSSYTLQNSQGESTLCLNYSIGKYVKYSATLATNESGIIYYTLSWQTQYPNTRILANLVYLLPNLKDSFFFQTEAFYPTGLFPQGHLWEQITSGPFMTGVTDKNNGFYVLYENRQDLVFDFTAYNELIDIRYGHTFPREPSTDQTTLHFQFYFTNKPLTAFNRYIGYLESRGMPEKYYPEATGQIIASTAWPWPEDEWGNPLNRTQMILNSQSLGAEKISMELWTHPLFPYEFFNTNVTYNQDKLDLWAKAIEEAHQKGAKAGAIIVGGAISSDAQLYREIGNQIPMISEDGSPYMWGADEWFPDKKFYFPCPGNEDWQNSTNQACAILKQLDTDYILFDAGNEPVHQMGDWAYVYGNHSHVDLENLPDINEKAWLTSYYLRDYYRNVMELGNDYILMEGGISSSLLLDGISAYLENPPDLKGSTAFRNLYTVNILGRVHEPAEHDIIASLFREVASGNKAIHVWITEFNRGIFNPRDSWVESFQDGVFVLKHMGDLLEFGCNYNASEPIYVQHYSDGGAEGFEYDLITSVMGYLEQNKQYVIKYNSSDLVLNKQNYTIIQVSPYSKKNIGTYNINQLEEGITVWLNTTDEINPATTILLLSNTDTRPKANFQTPLDNHAIEPVKFNATSSSDIDGEVTQYYWSFGDGSATKTSEKITIHHYENPGEYNVNLTVIDNHDQTSTILKTITISDPIIEQSLEPTDTEQTTEANNKETQIPGYSLYWLPFSIILFYIITHFPKPQKNPSFLNHTN